MRKHYREDTPTTPEARMTEAEFLEAQTNADVRKFKWDLVGKAVEGFVNGVTAVCVGAAISGVLYTLFWGFSQ